MTPIKLLAETKEISGIDLFIPAMYDIVWSLVPFVLLLLFFWLWALPRLNKVLDARSEAIEGGIEEAKSVQAEAAATLEEYNTLLREARDEAAQIREQARQDGAKILAEQKENASAEAARILANAQLQIEAERQAALVSLRTEVGSLALDLASGVLGESLGNDAKAKAVVDRFVTELGASDKSKAGK